MSQQNKAKDDSELRKKTDGERAATVGGWHPIGTGVVFPEPVSVGGGGGATAHVNYFGRCLLDDHDRALPGVRDDGTWMGEFHTFASGALGDIADHTDGQAFLMRELHGVYVGPIDPASVS
jgi:hypothetical protein